MESSSSPSTPSSSSQASASTPAAGSSQTASTPAPGSGVSPASIVKGLMEGAYSGPSGSGGAGGGTGSGALGASGGCPAAQVVDGEWMDVAHTAATHISASHAYKVNCVLSHLPPDSEAHFVGPYAAHGIQVELNPLERYKFRVAGVNATGVGPWSEILDYRPVNPGAEGLPTDIKVSKTQDGIMITWEPPFINSIETVYTVLLAIEKQLPSASSSKNFEQLYHGPDRTCLVSREQLARAEIDRTGQPCAIFRITAKTGSLQATIQVRWLQEKKEGPANNTKEKEAAAKN